MNKWINDRKLIGKRMRIGIGEINGDFIVINIYSLKFLYI